MVTPVTVATTTVTRKHRRQHAQLQPQAPLQPHAIHIVSWFLTNHDATCWTPLLDLLQSPPYQHVQKLEMVLPAAASSQGDIPTVLVEELAYWMATHVRLQDVVLYIVTTTTDIDTINPANDIAHYLLDAAHSNPHVLDGTCTAIPLDKFYTVVCDSLSTTMDGRLARHLALDGTLLVALKPPQLDQLAFDLSWDRSCSVVLWKDFDNATTLSALLPKLAHSPLLHTLKVCWDPTTAHAATYFPTHALLELLALPKCTLQRLFLGNLQFSPHGNLPPLIDAIQSCRTLQQVEFCACRFEPGCGRLLQQLTTAVGTTGNQQQQQSQQPQQLSSLQFYYPILLRKTDSNDDPKQKQKQKH